MPIFYSALKRQLPIGYELNLLNFKPAIECVGAYGLFSEQDIDLQIRRMFPEGLSSHGLIHLYAYNKGDEHSGFISSSHTVETTFEMFRALLHPTLPSRFQSYYACERYEDAISFASTQSEQCWIHEVNCERFLKVDMNWLTTGCSIPGNFLSAESYWAGRATNEPFWEILMSAPVTILNNNYTT